MGAGDPHNAPKCCNSHMTPQPRYSSRYRQAIDPAQISSSQCFSLGRHSNHLSCWSLMDNHRCDPDQMTLQDKVSELAMTPAWAMGSAMGSA
jgi:hypothetical protein